MALRLDSVSETTHPDQYRVVLIDDHGDETTIVCELSHFDRIGWGMNPVTKTDVFWRADGADSREVLAALVAFRERSQGG